MAARQTTRSAFTGSGCPRTRGSPAGGGEDVCRPRVQRPWNRRPCHWRHGGLPAAGGRARPPRTRRSGQAHGPATILARQLVSPSTGPEDLAIHLLPAAWTALAATARHPQNGAGRVPGSAWLLRRSGRPTWPWTSGRGSSPVHGADSTRTSRCPSRHGVASLARGWSEQQCQHHLVDLVFIDHGRPPVGRCQYPMDGEPGAAGSSSTRRTSPANGGRSTSPARRTHDLGEGPVRDGATAQGLWAVGNGRCPRPQRARGLSTEPGTQQEQPALR